LWRKTDAWFIHGEAAERKERKAAGSNAQTAFAQTRKGQSRTQNPTPAGPACADASTETDGAAQR
jgi:hypothetical protein